MEHGLEKAVPSMKWPAPTCALLAQAMNILPEILVPPPTRQPPGSPVYPASGKEPYLVIIPGALLDRQSESIHHQVLRLRSSKSLEYPPKSNS